MISAIYDTVLAFIGGFGVFLLLHGVLGLKAERRYSYDTSRAIYSGVVFVAVSAVLIAGHVFAFDYVDSKATNVTIGSAKEYTSYNENSIKYAKDNEIVRFKGNLIKKEGGSLTVNNDPKIIIECENDIVIKDHKKADGSKLEITVYGKILKSEEGTYIITPYQEDSEKEMLSQGGKGEAILYFLLVISIILVAVYFVL